MAQEIARTEDISPHEALLTLVKQAAGRAAYVDSVVGELLRRHIADGGDPLSPPDEIRTWLKESRNERNLAARTAKAAVDAGVMAALERRLDLEGELVATALSAALDVLDLTHDQRVAALGAAQQQLLAAADSSGTDDPDGGGTMRA